MKKLLLLWIARRWIRAAQRSFGGPDDGYFNTAGFQSAVRADFGILPPSQFAQFLITQAGGKVQSGGCHWIY